MKKTHKILFVIGIFVLLNVSIFILISFFQPTLLEEPRPIHQDRSQSFEENPNQFFHLDQERSVTDNRVIIDVPQITDFQSTEGLHSQLYTLSTGFTIPFNLMGEYEGMYFKGSALNFTDPQRPILFEITSQLDPTNGIPQGYIVLRIEDEDAHDISAYIFVDEDWKRAFPQTNIIWGAEYQNQAEFVFFEIRPGVYMTKIKDDPNRRSQNFGISFGGIVVGPLTRQEYLDDSRDDLTFMRLYG